MTFSKLEEGQVFIEGGNSLIKIKPFTVCIDGMNSIINAKDLDTHKFFSFGPMTQIKLDSDRSRFEELWESNKNPIDKALCYKFYKLGIESQF